MIYSGINKVLIQEFRNDMMHQFEITDLGMMHYFLGIEIKQLNDGVFISQEKYVVNLLD